MRVDWNTYFLSIATQVATRATCDRKHVGCVIVRDNAILATGYNGSVAGLPHCDDAGHDMEDSHCVRTIHAEMNALAQAARNGVRIEAATAYITAYPCWPCFKVLANAGISVIVYDELYRKDPRIEAAALETGILIHSYPRT